MARVPPESPEPGLRQIQIQIPACANRLPVGNPDKNALAGNRRPLPDCSIRPQPLGDGRAKTDFRPLFSQFTDPANATNPFMLSLEIYSDPVCPWCYIGKARLFAALKSANGPVFDIRWRPFQLNPHMSECGMDRAAYLRQKFGDGLVAAYSPVVEAAAEEGLTLNLDLIERMPNTLNAHRIIRWAEIEGVDATIVMDALFHAFFCEGEDLGQDDVLLALAERCGMDKPVTKELLQSGADKDYVSASDLEARRIGINSVPFFILGGRQAVSGAQPTELWAKVIDEIQNKGGSV